MLKGVAPPELIRQDFKHLKRQEHLNTSPDIEELLFVQSIEGRAHNGAGSFRKYRYVNTTIDDIVEAIGMEPDVVKRKRQALIDDITEFVRDVINGKVRDRLVNGNGVPFLGVPLFKKRTVVPGDVLKGMYIGGLRDDSFIRHEAENRYNVRIGYGKCYLVNINVMEEMGLDGELLAHQEHIDQLYLYKKKGLIIDEADLYKFKKGEVRYLYIRHKIGPGQSDDAALIAGGLLYTEDVALGIFLSDAIDTLEKYSTIFRDQDDELADYIGKNYKELNTSMDEVYQMTYLAAIPEEEENNIPDSSLRYFLTIDEDTGQTALSSHLNFIEGKPFYPIAISYNKILTSVFYRYIKNKVNSIVSLYPHVVQPVLDGLEKRVEEVMKRTVTVVSPDELLKVALNKAKEEPAGLIVVQDEEKNVLGVINPSDFLYLLQKV